MDDGLSLVHTLISDGHLPSGRLHCSADSTTQLKPCSIADHLFCRHRHPMRPLVALLFLMLVSNATPTRAADPAKPPAMKSKFDLSVDCSNLDRLNNMELNQCTGRAIEAADRDLNGVYGELTGALDAADRKLLVAAERAWIAWRDTECEFEAQGVSGYDKTGSGYGLEVGRCRLGLTKARAEQLRAYLRDVRQTGR